MAKKRKRSAKDDGDGHGDASAYAEHEQWRSKAITKLSKMPKELTKYWHSRHALFSEFDSGILLDAESWYSVTPEAVAARIAERCRCDVVLDAFCGVGGNAIQFAAVCERVIAIDIDPVKLKMAAHNAQIYGVADRITFVQGDFCDFARAHARHRAGLGPENDEEDWSAWKGAHESAIDVVFLSPPWGGVTYVDPSTLTPLSTPSKFGTGAGAVSSLSSLASANKPVPSTNAPPLKSTKTNALYTDIYPLSALAPIHGAELFALARAISQDVAYYLPRNVDLDEVAQLQDVKPWSAPRSASASSPQGKTGKELLTSKDATGKVQMIDCEEEWLRSRLKALTFYFGQLADWKAPADER